MTAPQPQQTYQQCVYVKFSPQPATRNADGTWTQNRPTLVIASSYGTKPIVFQSKPPDTPKPKGKEPPFPSTCTLGSDERVVLFDQKEAEREMNGSEVQQARTWLRWRWQPRDAEPGEPLTPLPPATPATRGR